MQHGSKGVCKVGCRNDTQQDIILHIYLVWAANRWALKAFKQSHMSDISHGSLAADVVVDARFGRWLLLRISK